MDLLLDRKLDIEEFCSKYEHTWNFELGETDLPASESELFERVFDVAAWYTPVAEDKLSYQGFKDEDAVLEVVKGVRRQLQAQERFLPSER
jgi:hypothetical protein